MALNPQGPGQIQNLLAQLLGGQGVGPVTGLGTNVPTAPLGPSPVRQPEMPTGAPAGLGGDMSGIWSVLAPYIALLGQMGGGIGAGAMPQTGLSQAAGGSFIQQLLQSLLGGTPGAAAAPAAPATPTSQPAQNVLQALLGNAFGAAAVPGGGVERAGGGIGGAGGGGAGTGGEGSAGGGGAAGAGGAERGAAEFSQ